MTSDLCCWAILSLETKNVPSFTWPTFQIKILTNHISDQRPFLLGYSKPRNEKCAFFYVTYFPVVTETNFCLFCLLNCFNVPDDSSVGVSKIYRLWNVITIGIYLFTYPLFSLQSPSSAAGVKYKPQGIYWPPAQGSSFSRTRFVRALAGVFEKKNRTTSVQVSVYRLIGIPRSYL